MDVRKEATVIAVLNGGGKLVMESIVETKASSILHFIHGLRGEFASELVHDAFSISGRMILRKMQMDCAEGGGILYDE